MDEKPGNFRKSSSSGDKGKKTKKRKNSKAKDRPTKRGGKSSGTPDGETNSDSAIDAVRRKILKSEGSSKNAPKRRKNKERKLKVNSPVHDINNIQSKRTSSNGNPITLKAIRGNHNLTSTTKLIKRSLLTQSTGLMSLQNRNFDSTNERLSSPTDDVSSQRDIHLGLGSLAHSTDTPPLRYSSIREDENVGLTSSDSDISEVVEKINESLRWENENSDEEKEKDRIRLYKLNRRKRYLVELIKKRQDKESIIEFARELSITDDDCR